MKFEIPWMCPLTLAQDPANPKRLDHRRHAREPRAYLSTRSRPAGEKIRRCSSGSNSRSPRGFRRDLVKEVDMERGFHLGPTKNRQIGLQVFSQVHW